MREKNDTKSMFFQAHNGYDDDEEKGKSETYYSFPLLSFPLFFYSYTMMTLMYDR